MRHAIHLVMSILMWILFGWYWYLVVQRQITPSSLRSLALLVVITAGGLLCTLAWVAHNKKLAGRNRRRGAPPAVTETLGADHLGRPLAGEDPAHLKGAKVVTVRLDEDGRKVLAAALGVRD